MKAVLFGLMLNLLVFQAYGQIVSTPKASRTVSGPELVPQSGFGMDVQSYFSFSANAGYLCAYNMMGEYLFYDLRNGRQIKKIMATSPAAFSLIYLAKPDFSKDERLVLIPEFPQGNYILYDLIDNKSLKLFSPATPDEKITHALFSADGKQLLLVSQKGGKQQQMRFSIFTTNGVLVKSCMVASPPNLAGETPALVRMLMKKQLKTLELIAGLKGLAATPDLGKVYMGFMGYDVYTFDIGAAAPDGRYTLNSSDAIRVTEEFGDISDVSVLGNKVVAKIDGKFTDETETISRKNDTLVIIDAASRRVERRQGSYMLCAPADYRSNALSNDVQASNRALNVYFAGEVTGKYNFRISCFDLLTNKELFTYDKGDPHFYYNETDFKGGTLNGGFILAVSDDQKYMLENTQYALVHNIRSHKIRNNISITRGGVRLNEPVFLDSFRLLVPKVTNDGFVFDSRTGQFDRLKRQLDCQDTARKGIKTHFYIDENAQMGLGNAAVAPDGKEVAIVSYWPADLCGRINGKQIDVYDDSLRLKKSYQYTDGELSHTLHFVPAKVPSFLSYYKLISFPETGTPVIKELKITQKKKTFYAADPVYLPSTGTIFSVLGTRDEPGDPNIIFAHFDLEGKLLNSYELKREKTPYKFQMAIFESRISPDGNRLLFGLHDGTVGIFDIRKMKMVQTWEHGEAFWVKQAGVYEHHMVVSGCFIDNDRFVTSGNDGKVRMWKVGEPRSTGVLNIDPMWLFGMVLSPDGRYLAGTDNEKNIRYLDVKTGETAFRITAPDYESAAIVANDGYYTGNRKIIKSLSFLHGGKAYDFSQFDLYLNRPDKILERLGHASGETIANYRRAYDKRLEKLGLSAANEQRFKQDYKAPELKVKDLPDELSETSKDKLSVTVTASDASSVPATLQVSVNGVPLYGVKGAKIKNAKSAGTDIPLDIPLSYGSNAISISVLNKEGVESLPELINIRRLGKAPKPNLHIITIGAGKFLDKNKDLQYPRKDATDLAALFAGSNLFGTVNQTVLADQQVTRAALVKLRNTLLKTSIDDYVVVFYAGHGMLDKQLKYYLATYDTDFANPKAKAIAYEDFEFLLDSIPARNKVLMLDACHSGEADKEALEQKYETTTGEVTFETSVPRAASQVAIGRQQSFDLMRSLFADLRMSNGTSVIAAAGASQYAVESGKWKNGVFTYALKSGIIDKKADVDNDGQIRLSELLEYLQVAVPALTNGHQQPCSRSENIVNDLLVWKL